VVACSKLSVSGDDKKSGCGTSKVWQKGEGSGRRPPLFLCQTLLVARPTPLMSLEQI